MITLRHINSRYRGVPLLFTEKRILKIAWNMRDGFTIADLRTEFRRPGDASDAALRAFCARLVQRELLTVKSGYRNNRRCYIYDVVPLDLRSNAARADDARERTRPLAARLSPYVPSRLTKRVSSSPRFLL